jgi:hypothetical protein
MSELYNFGKVINFIFVTNFNGTDMLKHRNLVGWVTFCSGVVGLISYLLVAGAVNFNFEFFSDSSLIFTIDGVSSTMLKWSMITDIFGYYFLLLPILFFINEWLEDKTGWRHVFTFCGAAYIFAGALGASILGATWPVLLDRFPLATPEQQEIIKFSFENLSLIVVGGIWNFFDALFFAVWFIAIGIFIKRENAVWGLFTIIVGLLSALDFTGSAFDLKTISEIALNLYLILAPLWAIGFGLAMTRNKVLNIQTD